MKVGKGKRDAKRSTFRKSVPIDQDLVLEKRAELLLFYGFLIRALRFAMALESWEGHVDGEEGSTTIEGEALKVVELVKEARQALSKVLGITEEVADGSHGNVSTTTRRRVVKRAERMMQWANERLEKLEEAGGSLARLGHQEGDRVKRAEEAAAKAREEAQSKAGKAEGKAAETEKFKEEIENARKELERERQVRKQLEQRNSELENADESRREAEERLSQEQARAEEEARIRRNAEERADTAEEFRQEAQRWRKAAERHRAAVARLAADNVEMMTRLRGSEGELEAAREEVRQLEEEAREQRGKWLDQARVEVEEAIGGGLQRAEEAEEAARHERQRADHAEGEHQAALHRAEDLANKLQDREEEAHRLESEREKAEQRVEEEAALRREAEEGLGREREEVARLARELERSGASQRERAEELDQERRARESAEERVRAAEGAKQEAERLLAHQRSVNVALMREKEGIEWQLLETRALLPSESAGPGEQPTENRHFGSRNDDDAPDGSAAVAKPAATAVDSGSAYDGIERVKHEPDTCFSFGNALPPMPGRGQ